MAERTRKHTIIRVCVAPPLHEKAKMSWSLFSVFVAVPNILKMLRFCYELTTPGRFLLSEESVIGTKCLVPGEYLNTVSH